MASTGPKRKTAPTSPDDVDVVPRQRSRPVRFAAKKRKIPAPRLAGQGFFEACQSAEEPRRSSAPPLGRGNGRAENQSGSGAGGVLPWNLAGTFPFGGPFTEGPFTEGPLAGGAATGAAETGTAGAAAADGPALAPGATLPGFGTPPAAGAAGASPADATGAGGGAEVGLAPSEHPANPLTATARADVATAHHRQRMGIERDPQESRFCDRPRRLAQARTGRNTHLPTVRADSRPHEGAGCHP
jgi:hypothetical protein